MGTTLPVGYDKFLDGAELVGKGGRPDRPRGDALAVDTPRKDAVAPDTLAHDAPAPDTPRKRCARLRQPR